MTKEPIYKVVREVSMQMVETQRRLHDVGLHATAAAVNEASKKLGWEAAEKIEGNGKAKRRRGSKNA